MLQTFCLVSCMREAKAAERGRKERGGYAIRNANNSCVMQKSDTHATSTVAGVRDEHRADVNPELTYGKTMERHPVVVLSK
jgi:hypothetical protein